MAPPRQERLDALVTRTLLALLLAVAVWNALVYEPVRGLDAEPYIQYETVLRLTGELPSEGASYTPPGRGSAPSR